MKDARLPRACPFLRHAQAPPLAGAVSGLLGIALAAACGGSSGNTFASAGSGGEGTTSTTHTATGPVTATSSGTGGASAGHHPSSALPVHVDGTPTSGTLVSTQTPDFYSFTGKRGDKLVIGTTAQGLSSTSNGFDPTIIDTYVTLLDPALKPIAADNDAWPGSSTDSQLYVVLPEDGRYFVEVEDCSAFAATHPSVTCNDIDPSAVTSFNYQIFVYHTDALATPVEVAAGSGQDGTTAKAAAIEYQLPKQAMTGAYGFYLLDGSFDATPTTNGAHVFAFTPPLDTAVGMGQRPRAEFWVQPVGPHDGDGSTANVKAWVTDDAAGKHIVAQVDQRDYTNGDDSNDGPLDLSFPITLGTTYYLFLQSTVPPPSVFTDYYFVEHFIGSYYLGQAELEGPTGQGKNDAPGNAEMLDLTSTGLYAIDGNISAPLSSAGADVDWFLMSVPDAATAAFVFCEVDRVGSGLGGFVAELHDGTDPLLPLGPPIGPEPMSPMTNFGNTMPITVAPGSTVYLKLTAQSQDGVDTGTDYRCYAQFQ